MIDQLTDLFLSSMLSLADALTALFWPAVFFLGLGLIVKRRALFADIRRAVRESQLNIKIMAFNVLFVVPFIGLFCKTIHQLAAGSSFVLIDQEIWTALPAMLTVAAAIFAGDFIGYWRHRLEHTRLLWPSHAVHHSDTEMTWLTLERFHPVNRLTTAIIDNGVLFALGFPPFALIANGLFRHYYGYFIHADLPWTYGRLGAVFVSPAMHRWHHSADYRFFNTNFATVFSIFDRVFGTYRVPGPCVSPLGVTDRMDASLLGQLAYALSPRAYRGLSASRQKTTTPDETAVSH